MTPRREGFTLIELLTVILIVGVLAAIGMTRFWSVKDRGFISAMQSDLRTFATAQEMYFEKNLVYASDPDSVTAFVPSPGIVLTVTHAQNDGWAATAQHPSAGTCGILSGNAPADAGNPATEVGIVMCD